VCFLLLAYVAPGSKCQMLLATCDGEYVPHNVVVLACEYLNDGVHGVHAAFEDEVDPKMFRNAAFDGDLTRAGADPMPTVTRFESLRADYPALDLAVLLECFATMLRGEEALLTPQEVESSLQTVVIATDGEILAVNTAWLDLAVARGFRGRGFVGLNYHDLMTAITKGNKNVEDAQRSLECFDAVGTGEEEEQRYIYACPSPRNMAGAYTARYTLEERAGENRVIVVHSPLYD
jgi:hypothetical protein